ncbi:UvrD-helicase domain-containing protein [Mycoplasma sp. 'Moose RK']|uniref:ATP-dependent helicase n=1 Tax=Mycoplasma sp. 'Moose RK' TaxID=2780095 RepID=UPI0018C225F3|nr:UvrD-helicase domain-containing protein [Mycoplasma sp. 'Moose RK']MBG0730876.1 UvrD-helicase domain-containing protein [Mycoplasma sp. 'Moose RK']
MSSQNILTQLNEKQKIAVISNNAHLRIVAGAGTGKTNVLTRKIAYIINESLAFPNRILALTFTNKAAQEMRQRVEKLIGEKVKDVQILTFHSLCNLILRFEAKNIIKIPDIPINDSNFNIIDEQDQRRIVEKLLGEYLKTNDDNDETKVSAFQAIEFISKAKNSEKSPQDAFALARDQIELIKANVYAKYLEKTRENNIIDFDDLLIYTKITFEKEAEIASRWQKKFDFVLVDEFQDTSLIQYLILKFFIKDKTRLIVVGDPDQTIYSWRGADPSLILNLEKDFPDLQTVILDKNYRSTQNILDAANHLISNNKNRIKKNLVAHSSEQIDIRFEDLSYERGAEVNWIYDKILELATKQKANYGDIAILARSNFYFRSIIEKLDAHNIPYIKHGNSSLINKKEVREAIYFLKVIENADSYAFEQIINVPPKKIGVITVQKLNELAKQFNLNLHDFLFNYYSQKIVLKPEQGKIPLGHENQTKIKNLFERLAAARRFKIEIEEKRPSVFKLFSQVLDSFLKKIDYFDTIKDPKVASETKEILQKYYTVLDNWQSENPTKKLADYLDFVALSNFENSENNNRINLLTVHSSKGLEFEYVFLVGMNQGIFPSQKVLELNSLDEYEEERRLAFVAITRAKRLLYITNGFRANFSRNLKNSWKQNLSKTSTFVSEMKIKAEQFYQFRKLDETGKLNYNRTSIESVEFNVGDQINHLKFGKGIILEVRADSILVKFFELSGDNGIKTLVKNHKSIEKIS